LWTRVLSIVERRWVIPDRPPHRPGCLIVPSYAVRDRETPTRPTRAQIDLAHAWWLRFPEARVILSTGDNQGLGVTNAAVMARYARSLGIPAACLIEEDRSRNTRENLQAAMAIVEREHLAQPTLVTLDLYARRAVATARRLGWHGCYWVSVRAEGEPAYGWKRFQTRSRATILCWEVGSAAVSKLIGWV